MREAWPARARLFWLPTEAGASEGRVRRHRQEKRKPTSERETGAAAGKLGLRGLARAKERTQPSSVCLADGFQARAEGHFHATHVGASSVGFGP